MVKKFILLFVFLSATESYAQRATSKKILFEFPEEINESSGIAISRNNPGIFWTHNDSGNDPIIYGINPGFGIVARIRLLDVEGRDLEDIAVAPCSIEVPTKYCIFVADIGDNWFARGTKELDFPKIYIIEEPTLGTFSKQINIGINPKLLRVAYEDNKPYNAEGFAVTENLDLLIITKGDTREDTAKLYRLPYETWIDNYDTKEPIYLNFEDNLIRVSSRFQRVTAATYLDGILAIKTPLHIYFYKASELKNNIDWVEYRPACFFPELSINGEALDMLDHNTVVLSSENATSWSGNFIKQMFRAATELMFNTILEGVMMVAECPIT